MNSKQLAANKSTPTADRDAIPADERTLKHSDRWLVAYQRHDAQADAPKRGARIVDRQRFDQCCCEADECVPMSVGAMLGGVAVCLLLFGGTVYFIAHLISWIYP